VETSRIASSRCINPHRGAIEERGKAVAVTNEIRREKRALFEQLRLNREMEQMLAKEQDAASAAPRSNHAGASRSGPLDGSNAATWQGTDQRIPHHRAAVISVWQSGLGHPWQWPGNGQTHYRPSRPS
jgi:hypothetical protein